MNAGDEERMLVECRDAENQIGAEFSKNWGRYDLCVHERSLFSLVFQETIRYALFMSNYTSRYTGFMPMPPNPPDPRSNAGQVDMLAEEITKFRAQGMTWAQIEIETGISASECAVIASNYLKAAYTGTSIQDARQLQIMRLEMLMQMLYKMVEDGDTLTQGRQTTNLIATINQVTELLDLRKDRLRDEQIKLNQEQGGLILHILEVVKQAVINDVLGLLAEASVYNTETGRREIPDMSAVRARLERDWSGWFATAADEALMAASGDSNDSTSAVPQASTTRQPASPTRGDRYGLGANAVNRTIKGELGSGK